MEWHHETRVYRPLHLHRGVQQPTLFANLAIGRRWCGRRADAGQWRGQRRSDLHEVGNRAFRRWQESRAATSLARSQAQFSVAIRSTTARSFSSRLGMRSPAPIRRTRSLRISKGSRTIRRRRRAQRHGDRRMAGRGPGTRDLRRHRTGDGYFVRARGAGEPHLLPGHDSRDAGLGELRQTRGLTRLSAGVCERDCAANLSW